MIDVDKCQQFLDFFDYLVSNCKYEVEIPPEVQDFYDLLKDQGVSGQADKPLLTETGLQILEYLQSNESKGLKAKDIADGMDVSSRKISGAIRKLVTDGFVDKFGKSPVIYSLTDKGRNFDTVNYKERQNNEKEHD